MSAFNTLDAPVQPIEPDWMRRKRLMAQQAMLGKSPLLQQIDHVGELGQQLRQVMPARQAQQSPPMDASPSLQAMQAQGQTISPEMRAAMQGSFEKGEHAEMMGPPDTRNYRPHPMFAETGAQPQVPAQAAALTPAQSQIKNSMSVKLGDPTLGSSRMGTNVPTQQQAASNAMTPNQKAMIDAMTGARVHKGMGGEQLGMQGVDPALKYALYAMKGRRHKDMGGKDIY